MGIDLKVYLCGPINGCTDAECNDWREYAKKHLNNTIDPMKRDYRGKEGNSYREIVDLDKIDVRSCDIILANCPTPSVGTSMEVFYAWTLGKPVVAVVPTGGKVSPWLRYHTTKVCETMRDAIEWIISL